MYSVIIPTYNRHSDLYKCLSCFSEYFTVPESGEQPFTVEVIVSDDAKQNELKEYLSANFPWVRYFEGPSRGPAANRNNGAAQAKGEWLVFTDDDCLPGRGWLHSLHDMANQATVLEGKTIAERPRERLDEESPINFGGYLWSCNFAIKKSLFDSLHGFDENFPFAAMEDMDLKKRIDDEGAKIIFVPNAVVTHPWRRSRGMAFWGKQQKSEFYFWEKHKNLAPASLPRYYAYLGLRSLVKITIPGALKYRCRGLRNAIEHDAWLFSQSLRFLLRRPPKSSRG
ncbi:GalNAc(5)-diNAcBac-PP-undecaprenol beta-1,3-glucosyltransferase [Variovorax sp. SRS16]|uniref:glycosyltransferase family 2 protein n=1 Tax=Variovorax sp. SRS16 TaxID=282217 RepID=UPI0013192ECF|nr:glycosyltransferase [Variovorax sp. SRS16]VTU14217.1 GalNAc(5)-diNAcBac-PP-undecaprenol beta-1,3-glucosyltransferase [Variovorax sp. SRS16]